MTFPKQLCLALAALGLALPAAAQFPTSTPAITFVRERTGGRISEPVRYADGTPLLAGEFVSPLYVLTKEALSAESPLPFTVSSNGAVTATNPDTHLVWSCVGSSGPQTQVKITMKDGLPQDGWEFLGENENGSYDKRELNCSWPTDGGSLPAGYSCSLYLLTFDTRTSDAGGAVAAGGEEAPIYAWGATFVCSSTSLPGGGFIPLLYPYVLNVPEDRREELEGLFVNPTYLETALTDQDAEFTIACNEVLVNGKPAGSVEEAAEALTPGVASMTQKGGTLTLGLTPPTASGLTPYALWTATALDGEWQPFAEAAKKKGLALEGEMRYSRLRIEETESLEIPMFEGDPTRFYRLQALGRVEESGE